MALIGSWGNIIFLISPYEIKTFDDMSWESTAKYASHERHLKDPLIEFTGRDNDTISLNMFFSVFLGVKPIAEITKLLDAQRRGEVNRLVIGPKAYGLHKWVITNTSKSLEKFDNHGNLLAAKVSVSFLAYIER